MVILCVCIITCVNTCLCTCVSMKTEDHNCCLIPSLTVSSYTYSPAETGSPLFWQEDLASRLELLYLCLPNAKLPVGYHICGGSIFVLGISISLPTCITSILPTKPSPNPYVNYSVTQNHSQHIVYFQKNMENATDIRNVQHYHISTHPKALKISWPNQ